METRPKYLTKSRFKLALECERKLYYTGKQEYPDKKIGDSFLEALAEGGYQVGELAKLYHPGGHEITTLDKKQALAETDGWLQKENCILYEPAFLYKNLFIRVDVLVKNNDCIDVIEVKAKSCDFHDSSGFRNKSGYIEKSWKPYLYDAAFQKYVITNALPGKSVNTFLMLADKNAKATVDGLNQLFLIGNNPKGRSYVEVKDGISSGDLGKEVLCKIQVDDIIDDIFANRDQKIARQEDFADWLRRLAEAYEQNVKIPPDPGSKCGQCEFFCSADEEKKGYKNGYKECWKEAFDLTDDEFIQPNILELWDFRKKDSYIAGNKLFLSDLSKEDLPFAEKDPSRLSRTERQWLQIRKTLDDDAEPYVLAEPLKSEMNTWKYPLHFIDFETSMVAIPFHRGMSPYEGIAFQFSHHIVTEDMRIYHAGEYLHRQRGRFPNFDFIRALKEQLCADEGTIFRYAAHENTFLNIIYNQLKAEDERTVPDRNELCAFIEEISHPTGKAEYTWNPGPRDMVDLRDIILRYIYLPQTKGSNSIKAVLPAVLGTSKILQEKYTKPVYGKGLEIESSNFSNWQWVQFDDDGNVIDPYKLLPPVFESTDMNEDDLLITNPKLAEGGAAMLAYARMQFSEMSVQEEEALASALLKYCELDTFAMVLIWEYLQEM